jgi:hypothetical protein
MVYATAVRIKTEVLCMIVHFQRGVALKNHENPKFMLEINLLIFAAAGQLLCSTGTLGHDLRPQ